MSLLTCIRFAFRSLTSRDQNKKRSMRRMRSGIVGIALSIVPLLVVYEVASGMVAGISERYLETASYHLQVQPIGTSADFKGLASALLKNPQVRYAGYEVQGVGLVAKGDLSKPGLIRGIDPGLTTDAGFMRFMRLKSGAFQLSDSKDIVLGESVAREIGAVVGDRIRIITMASDNAPPRVSFFNVRGIVSAGYHELDRLWVFTGIERAREIIPDENAQEFLGVKLNDPAIGSEPGTEPSLVALADELSKEYRVRTWYELNHSQYENFASTKNVLLFIMFLVLLLASVNISSCMILIVFETQTEIATLKSLGASPGPLVIGFVLAGGFIGLLGLIGGLAAGSVASVFVNEILSGIEWVVNVFAYLGSLVAGSPFETFRIFNADFYLDRIPVQFHLTEFVGIALISLVLALAASFVPAMKAARLRPLQVMRKG